MAMTKDTYDWLMSVAHELDISEDDIEEVTTMSLEQMLKTAKTPKQFEEYASLLSIQSHLNRSEMVMPDRLSAYYENKILASVPGDMVVFNNQDEQLDLVRLFFPPTWKGVGTPIDILKEGTVPLMDMFIRVPLNADPEFQCDFRIVIFPDYQERLQAEAEVSIIGAYLIYPRNIRSKRVMFGLLQVIPNQDFICDSGLIGWIGSKPDECIQFLVEHSGSPYHYHMMLAPHLLSWYCVQLTLLNPPTLEVYQKLREETQEAVKTTYVFRKRNKVKYVKKIYLNPKKNLVPKDTSEGGDKYKKKCPYWRVIGHWRTYKKDGKRIWINSYWKGRNRNFIPKHTMDNMRERVVVTGQKGSESDG